MIKIDMIERNLLERTCDVRWWALEKAFWECITLADQNPDQLTKIIKPTRKAPAKQSGKSSKAESDLKNAIELACTRLEDIRNSYTLCQI